MTEQKKDVPSTTNGSPDTANGRSGKSYNWVSKCGERQPTKRAIHAHQKQCPICMSMIHSGPSSGKEYPMRCGAVVKTRALATEHFRTCIACQELRRATQVATCKGLTHTDEMRRRYSETAKKTAARGEIKQHRAQRLKNWRDANPEAFSEIRAKAHASPKRSKMESWLAPLLAEWGFVRNIRLRCGGLQKQVDFVHWEQEILIEVDGPWHFLPVRSPESLAKVQQRDRMLDAEAIRRGWRMIRFSMENFRSHTGELKSPSLEQLRILVEDRTWSGIRCFGSLYEQISWDGIKVTISK